MVAESPFQNQHNEANISEAESVGQFQWTKQWYPIAVVEFLDPSKPHPVQILGISMVLWRDGAGQWQCFDDACPHRLAPLSEGRVEADGSLLCAYHAWRFNSSGQCIRMPQAKDAELEAKHCASSKACAVAYPTQERQGLLWVWPESGSEAQVESQQRSPRVNPELDDTSGKYVKAFWNVRDLPYGWDFFMENVADPAHVPVSHHGLMGSRYTDAKFYDMPNIRKLSTQDGFAFDVVPAAGDLTGALHDFQPPCLMRIEMGGQSGGGLLLILYATPTRPGWCRHIGCQVLMKNEAGKTPSGLAFFALPMPVWLGHILASVFLHQDLVFLHHQQKRFSQRQGSWLEEVYTPNPQDKMVLTFRQWLHRRAGGSVPWPDYVASSDYTSSKADLFDVWSTHTQHCYTCQTALKRLNRLIWVLWIGAIVSLILAIWLDARSYALVAQSDATGSLWSMPTTAAWLSLAIAMALGMSGYLLKKLTSLFYRYEFSHSDND